MFEPVAFMYHDVFDGRGFSRMSDSWRRYALGRRLFRDLGLLASDGAMADNNYPLVEIRPDEAIDAEILRVHTSEHLARVREADQRNTGFLDYGDTPAWSGILRRARFAVGGTVGAARLVASGRFRRAFNPAGGLHHAMPDRAAGFCPFNDVAIAARCLQAEYGMDRIAIVDLDGHHGDGTEAIFYNEPILTISLHRFDGHFFPRTGTSAAVGRGAGFHYNLNVPLDRKTDGPTYLDAFDRLVEPKIRAYRPDVIIVVGGADSHIADPLVRLALTLPTFRDLATRLATLSDDLCDGRLIALAAGGYAPEHVARVWAVFVGTLSGAWQPTNPRLQRLFDEEASRSRDGTF